MSREIDGELAELLKQVGWHVHPNLHSELTNAIKKYGYNRWSEGYDDGFRKATENS